MKSLLRLLRLIPAARLKPRPYLPDVHDDARNQFLSDWWNGIGAGVVIGFGMAVIFLKG